MTQPKDPDNLSNNMASEVEGIIDDWGRKFEPATGTRGQGGLPVTGTVTDWQLTISKDGWKHYKNELEQAITTYIDSVVEQKVLEGRINELQQAKAMTGLPTFDKRLETLRHRYEQMKGGKNG